MQVARAIGLALADPSPFAPSHRREGPGRKPKRDAAASRLLRTFRDAIAQALEETAAGTPRLGRYPY
jgi:hypothetical protein